MAKMGSGKKTKVNIPAIGQGFGKPDTERIGFFAEMSYLVGQKYTPVIRHVNIRDPKKRQMFPGYPKWKTGLQDCYFDEEFKRLFIGEGIPRKRPSDDTKKGKKATEEKKPVRPFIPSQYPHPLYQPGNAYGYFSNSEALSPRQNKPPEYVKPKRGIYTNPGKLGGPGYIDICIDRYPEHANEKYEPQVKAPEPPKIKRMPLRSGQPPKYFDPNPYLDTQVLPPYKKTKEIYIGKKVPTFKPSSPTKWDGGCKDGNFEKYPVYVEDRYNDPFRIDNVLDQLKAKKEAKKKQKEKKRVNPPMKPTVSGRTWQCPSVMKKNAEINTHAMNWTEMKPITFSQKFFVV